MDGSQLMWMRLDGAIKVGQVTVLLMGLDYFATALASSLVLFALSLDQMRSAVLVMGV